MAKFHELMENEKALIPKQKSNKDDPIVVED
jgi:hypothetical protein